MEVFNIISIKRKIKGRILVYWLTHHWADCYFDTCLPVRQESATVRSLQSSVTDYGDFSLRSKLKQGLTVN